MNKCEKSVDFWVKELTKDTDPEHLDFEISDLCHDMSSDFGYGQWLWNCGYNAGLVNLQTKVNTYCIPQWISVKDRMPEKHGWYLVARKKTYPTDSGMQVCFFCHGRFMVDKKIKITHWKPLPEYPESEEKSE